MKVALSWDNTLGFASKIKFTKEYPTQKNEHRQKPMNYKHKKIAIKVGSNVLTKADGTLDLEQMIQLTDQIARLHRAGVEIVLISSGAVASGRSLLSPSRKLDAVEQRQLFATVGQVKLINHYLDFFSRHDIVVGQVLTTKTNFEGRNQYLNQRNCMRVMIENGVIPIVNENDAVSVTELMFTDNDELSGLIASMMNMEALIILSNINGVYTGNPADDASELITEVKPGEDLSDFIQSSKSEFGRGGMKTKASIARKIADEGIDVYIANGKSENILLELLDDKKKSKCTHFIAKKSEVSSVKKWIAHSVGFAKGEIYVDENAANALCSDKAISLLPVGIIRMNGNFEKDDIVSILREDGTLIGMGKAQYNNEKATQVMGKKAQRPIVHYDYFYLI